MQPVISEWIRTSSKASSPRAALTISLGNKDQGTTDISGSPVQPVKVYDSYSRLSDDDDDNDDDASVGGVDTSDTLSERYSSFPGLDHYLKNKGMAITEAYVYSPTLRHPLMNTFYLYFNISGLESTDDFQRSSDSESSDSSRQATISRYSWI